MIEIIDCEQNSSDWFAARMGIPTASEFSTVMAKGRDGGASVNKSALMPPWSSVFTDEQIENMADYLGYVCKCKK